MKSKTKKERQYHCVPSPSPNLPSILFVRGDGPTDSYAMRPLETDMGTAFHLSKLTKREGEEGGEYDCLLARDGNHICDCPGWTMWQKCKHIAGLLHLRAKGELP